MSASLVGSEMCIRDSPPRTPRTVMFVASLGISATRRRMGPSGAPGSLSAVSYTHLTLPTICSV
eukprot:1987784-Alexandrium_andersonii.AAC.1